MLEKQILELIEGSFLPVADKEELATYVRANGVDAKFYAKFDECLTRGVEARGAGFGEKLQELERATNQLEKKYGAESEKLAAEIEADLSKIVFDDFKEKKAVWDKRDRAVQKLRDNYEKDTREVIATIIRSVPRSA